MIQLLQELISMNYLNNMPIQQSNHRINLLKKDEVTNYLNEANEKNEFFLEETNLGIYNILNSKKSGQILSKISKHQESDLLIISHLLQTHLPLLL